MQSKDISNTWKCTSWLQHIKCRRKRNWLHGLQVVLTSLSVLWSHILLWLAVSDEWTKQRNQTLIHAVMMWVYSQVDQSLDKISEFVLKFRRNITEWCIFPYLSDFRGLSSALLCVAAHIRVRVFSGCVLI